jgi:hypothetical protein
VETDGCAISAVRTLVVEPDLVSYGRFDSPSIRR